MYRRRRAPGIGIFLLVAQLLQVGRIPPVTLGIIVLNAVIYLRLLNGLPSVSEACISVHHVWYNHDWKRIFFSPFFHLDDMHLYYNMVSFLWKGISLESRLGSGGMLYLITVFSVLTSLMLLVIDKCMFVVFDDPSYLYTCAAGFSGVIFAVKVVTTYHLPPGVSYVMMLPVPSRLACWVELILIQVLVPRTSFTGHLAGILVGLLYVKGPLKTLMNSFDGFFRDYPVTPSYTYHSGTSGNSSTGYATRPSYTYHSGASGQNSRQHVPDEEDEELQAAIRESLRESRQNSAGNTSREPSREHSREPSHTNHPSRYYHDERNLSSEEMRRRRLQRFQS